MSENFLPKSTHFGAENPHSGEFRGTLKFRALINHVGNLQLSVGKLKLPARNFITPDAAAGRR